MRQLVPGLFLVALLGCGPREPYPVSVAGTVTLDGKPLPQGNIFFITAGKVPEILDIQNGHFSGMVKTGTRRVEIAACRPYQIPPDVPKSMHPLMQGGKENYLPEKYHRQSTLTAEVKGSGDNHFQFELLSSKN